MNNNQEIIKILKRFNIKYNNLELYKEAFAHSSFTNEHKELKINNYDRLEFLGDSVLGMLTSEYLFNKHSNMSAGELSFYRSKVIRKEFLSDLSKKFGYGNATLLGNGNSKSKISPSIYEDIFESFIGALYLDLGINQVRQFLKQNFFNEVEKVNLENLKDNKTKLQEFLQAEKKKPVIYKLIKENKSEKNKIIFEVEAIVDGITLGKGKGKTKKEAEQIAAEEAYNKMVK